jgi:transcriptional regulator with XRE-family HTH domain
MFSDLTTQLAERLKNLRLDRNWSLEKLSSKSGVSRATLSRLEKGDGSPTAEMLGKLCEAFALTPSQLFAMIETPFEQLVPVASQHVWIDETSGFTRQVVSPPSDNLRAEAIKGHLKAGSNIHYDGSPLAGLEHHLVIISGQLFLTVDGQEHSLKTGDCLRYRLNGPSQFRTNNQEDVQYLIFMVRL